ncbi:MAG: efflux RND transporter periplasmic adaptor subunit [Candidatus Schekmanbacteria bacterium]|nr:efflux RND transporter periplasmic adaptor subunit [Candidatus Schekmanbacteria bacterium]
MEIDKLKINRTSENQFYAKQKRRRYITRSITAVVLIFLAFLLYQKGVFTPTAKVEITTVSSVYPFQAKTTLNATGYVVAERKAAVASKGTGRLEVLNVEEGDQVKKGEIIGRLENRDTEAALKRAEANLDSALFLHKQAKAELDDSKLDLDRKKKLVDSGTVSKSSFDIAEARYKKAVAGFDSAEALALSAKASVSEARVGLDYTYIRAPFDGTILTKNADVGEIVAPFASSVNSRAAVVTMADMSSLLVEADVSESNINLVKIGQPCIITLDAYPDKRYRGKVHMIVPTAERAKATIMTKVKFTDIDSKVLPEMSSRISFLSEEATDDMLSNPRTAITSTAIATRDGRKVVFVVTDSTVTEKQIETGGQLGDLVEIKSGVNPGEKLVLNPSDSLKSGAKIEVAEK